MSAPFQSDTTERRYSETQLVAAATRAAEDILARIKAGDEGERDLLNLQINASAVYLRDTHANLDDVIRSCYQREPEEVLEWTQR